MRLPSNYKEAKVLYREEIITIGNYASIKMVQKFKKLYYVEDFSSSEKSGWVHGFLVDLFRENEDIGFVFPFNICKNHPLFVSSICFRSDMRAFYFDKEIKITSLRNKIDFAQAQMLECNVGIKFHFK